ncbi:MAG: hypothetical protein Q4E78_04220 [Eubacteriales bacterium]|nr:hypothetical protein [Eubacteriales bacterium]
MKDMLRRVTKDKRKYIIICACAVLIIALISVSVIIMQLKHNKNIKKNVADNTIAETKTVQETTAQETTEADSTEETTEEQEKVVVEEKYVEEFFENEIATEDEEALALPSRKLTSEFIPYDGVSREITCYGDSMMAGAGCTTPGTVNGLSIFGWSSPITLERLSGITTHNLGVSGENSYTITFRAGGIKLYIDRDITISEDDYARATLIDENGNVFTYDDYSGYGIDYDPYPGDMYINGYLCDVDNAGNNQVSIKLTQGYSAYSGSEARIIIYDSETDEYSEENGLIQELAEKETTGDTDAEQPAETPAESPTESPTEKPTEVSTTGKVTIQGGTQAMTRASQERSAKDILVLEMGSNGGWANNYQELILQYDNIILNSGCKYYIILGDTDDPGTSLADDNQGELNEYGSYIGIGDTAWEAALREAYGEHFFNTRTYMIQNGLNDCGLDTTTEDLENFKKGNISKQLRYDWTHFNCYGYYSKGVGIYKKGVELGYWS